MDTLGDTLICEDAQCTHHNGPYIHSSIQNSAPLIIALRVQCVHHHIYTYVHTYPKVKDHFHMIPLCHCYLSSSDIKWLKIKVTVKNIIEQTFFPPPTAINHWYTNTENAFYFILGWWYLPIEWRPQCLCKAFGKRANLLDFGTCKI